jgi:uncharacterized protein (TIGR03437 family)
MTLMNTVRRFSLPALCVLWTTVLTGQQEFFFDFPAGVYPSAPQYAFPAVVGYSGNVPFKCVTLVDLGKTDFVVISPSSGTAPITVGVGLNPFVVPYMLPGYYRENAVCAPTVQTGLLGGFLFHITITILPSAPPTITSVTSAASLQPFISPGTPVTIRGTLLGTQPLTAQYGADGLYPTGLGNTSVTFGGVPAPLLYVSADRIDTSVPYEVAGQKTVNVVVTHKAQSSPAFSMPLMDTSPGIITSGPRAIYNVPGNAFNDVNHPATKGMYIVLTATGAGLWNQSVPNGTVLLYVLGNCCKPAAPVSLTIGGQPAPLLYAGAAPYEVSGTLQVNAMVPTNIDSGPQPVVLTIGANDNSQQQVTVFVQ